MYEAWWQFVTYRSLSGNTVVTEIASQVVSPHNFKLFVKSDCLIVNTGELVRHGDVFVGLLHEGVCHDSVDVQVLAGGKCVSNLHLPWGAPQLILRDNAIPHGLLPYNYVYLQCYDCAWLSLTALSTVTCNLWL
jgi:hypothetical protein